jgi:hypothetical protein
MHIIPIEWFACQFGMKNNAMDFLHAKLACTLANRAGVHANLACTSTQKHLVGLKKHLGKLVGLKKPLKGTF